jgi:hypothetical protein
VPVSGLHIVDHSLDGCAQLMRCYGGTLTDCTIERISHVNGVYKPGIGRGVFLSANTTLNNLTIRNVVNQSGDPITNPGDVYGGITLGGKDANDIGSGFLFEDLDFDGMWASYVGYQNCDAITIEKGYTDGTIRRCKFANGSDAGLDRKGAGWTADDVTITNFRESTKVWTNLHDGKLTSINPRVAHHMVMNGAEHVIDMGYYRGTNPKLPVGRFENAPGILRYLNVPDFSGLPAGQVLATRDGPSTGSKVIINGTETVI